MTFQPMTDVINGVAVWGKKSGADIVKAFSHEGDWTGWAQVGIGLYFMDYDNVMVARKQKVDNQTGDKKIEVDLVLLIENGKNVAIKLVCEILPPEANAIGEADAWSRVKSAYDCLKEVNKEKFRPVAMGILVSGIANDNARYHLCDINLFDRKPLYSDKSGSNVNLYFNWV